MCTCIDSDDDRYLEYEYRTNYNYSELLNSYDDNDKLYGDYDDWEDYWDSIYK